MSVFALTAMDQMLTTISQMAGVVVLLGALVFAWFKVGRKGAVAEASGEANQTWAEVHEANRARIEQLEQGDKERSEQMTHMAFELAEAKGKIKILEEYAAPELGSRVEAAWEANTELLRTNTELLKGVVEILESMRQENRERITT